MAATRRPDLSKKSDIEIYDLVGYHVAEALKRQGRDTLELGASKPHDEEDVEVDTTPMVDDATDVLEPKPTKKTAPLKKLIEEGDEFDPFADPDEDEDEEELTSEQVRLALKDYAAIHDKDAAMDIMRKVGKAESVPKINPKLYRKVIDAAEIKRPKK